MNKSVVIIGSKVPTDKNNTSIIADALSKKNITVHKLYWENLLIEIKKGYLEVRHSGRSLKDYGPSNVLMFGWYQSAIYKELAFVVAQYLHNNEIDFWNSESLSQRSTGKLSCLAKLASSGVPVTETVFSLDFSNLNSDEYKFPFILKASMASRGKRNFLITDQNEFEGHAFDGANDLMMQPFLPNDHDLRVICYNSEPMLILKRSRLAGSRSHLNNVSAQGKAEWTAIDDVPSALLLNSKKICTVLNREMCGIDYIPDEKSSFGYSCLEVNAIPQLTSGYDVSTKMDSLAQTLSIKLGKKIT